MSGGLAGAGVPLCNAGTEANVDFVDVCDQLRVKLFLYLSSKNFYGVSF